MADKKQKRINRTRILRILRRLFVNRNVKDRLFRVVFRDKKYQLQLYNAINGTNFQNEEDLIVYTLEDVIYLKMKNDLSFIIVGSTLNLYEHQSTFNPNMPLRAVMYFARQYEIFLEENELDVYGKRLIKIPVPQMIVFYNGDDTMPEELELKLSDAYMEAEGIRPAMECVARVININYGHNKDLMRKCERLEEYSRFIQILNECKQREKDIKKATYMAVEQGIAEGILEDILIRQKAEVCAMILTEYNEKRHMKTLYQDGYDSGYGYGYDCGYDSGYGNGYDSGKLEEQKKMIRYFLKKNMSEKEIMEILGCNNELIEAVKAGR
ncbi:MAG: hypothetical protein J6K26_00885 [Lachnospiraceae bacterium]|nr:hypothetical protein [Lachnospiraceae bacterium]